MAFHIFKGNGAPTSTPAKVGMHYIDETADEAYISVGTSSSADWQKQLSGTHSHAASDVTDFDTEVGNHADVDANTTHRGTDSGNPHSVTKSEVNLGNVDDLQQIPMSQKGAASGVATLDGSSKVPSAQLPSYVDDVEEYANQAAFPGTGESGKIYVALDTLKTYRWTGSVYAEISPSEVNSVAGKTGIVTLDTDDVSESANLYYTEARVDANSNVVANTAKNSYPSADATKLAGIEAGSTADQTGAEIKASYEGEANTNAFTDADESKLDGIAAGATVNDTDANLKARANHTGTQAASTVSDFDAAVTASTHAGRTDDPHSVTKTQVGLGSVDNTSDADKPVSTAAQTALDAKLDDSQKGAANGLAELGADSKIPSAQLPAIAITDTHVVADESAQLALTVQKGDVAVRSDENKSYIALNSDNIDMGDWELLKTPTDAVSSVVGQTGVVTAAQIKTAYEALADTNAFTDADETKLDGIEASATADQTGAEIKTAYELEADTNAFTDTLLSKLNGIEASATADQSAAEIKTAYESNTDTNEFSDAEQTKLSGIATGATANDTDANLKNRANHTGTQAVSTLSDFDSNLAGKTNTTSFTPTADYHVATKKYVDDNGGGGSYCATVCFAETLPYAQVTSSSYSKVGSFPFPGTTAVGSPTDCIIASYLNAGTDMDIRVYDVTNAQTICELIDQSNGTVALVDLGTLSNLPAAAAIFEVHMLATGSGPKARIESLILR